MATVDLLSMNGGTPIDDIFTSFTTTSVNNTKDTSLDKWFTSFDNKHKNLQTKTKTQSKTVNLFDPFDDFSDKTQSKNDNLFDLLNFNDNKNKKALNTMTTIHNKHSNNKSNTIMSIYNYKTNNVSSLATVLSKIKSKPKGFILNFIGLPLTTVRKTRYQTGNIKISSIMINKKQYKLSSFNTIFTSKNTISDLKHFIRNTYNINYGINIIIIFSHSVLNDNNKTLQSYGIINDSCLTVSICENTFKYNTLMIKDKNNLIILNKQLELLRRLEKLRYFQIKKMRYLDIFTYTQSSDCIQMPCGHGIPAESLYYYAESQYKSNKVYVKCPHLSNGDNDEKNAAADNSDHKLCNEIWHWPLIKYIIISSKLFSTNNIYKLEILSSLNTLKNEFSFTNCPNVSCNCLLYKHIDDDKYNKKAYCPVHVAIDPLNSNNNTQFCWKCGNIWCNYDSNDNHYCGNLQCDTFEEEYNNILLNCDTKKIGRVINVPSIRACPNCSQLIYHNESCKHMDCVRCKKSFCFVCLSIKTNGKWSCGSSSAVCSVAPKQVGNELKNKYRKN